MCGQSSIPRLVPWLVPVWSQYSYHPMNANGPETCPHAHFVLAGVNWQILFETFSLPLSNPFRVAVPIGKEEMRSNGQCQAQYPAFIPVHKFPENYFLLCGLPLNITAVLQNLFRTSDFKILHCIKLLLQTFHSTLGGIRPFRWVV